MVSEAGKLKSAVDRTRFHTQYVARKTDEKLRDQILLTKQFMKGIGVYGAEAKIRGFSGLLCEVLTIAHGTFLELVRSAAEWSYGHVIDVESKGKPAKDFSSPLVVIDPTDPNRNAAAAVSASKLARFIHACRCFLESPSERFFFPRKRRPFTENRLLRLLESRGTRILLLTFTRPEALDDVFYPQLQRLISWLRAELHKHGFNTAGPSETAFCEDGNQVFVLFEVEVPSLSRIEKRHGPKVERKEHVKRFLEKHAAEYPYLEEDHWCVDSKRRFTAPDQLVSFLIENQGESIPTHIRKSISQGWRLVTDRDAISIQSTQVRLLVTQHFAWKFPWEV